ncbi:large conductance mechanosensitive channel protein MscL [Actinomadura parmotrematis]|uniref:Large conductance mechanosensitive channel protein MscL n=1 Tax=Actinomadura parmotrematis TaxID=2864039 RepID=A0ABS7FMV0_9ACTN|nr:large conductance mechanosensitive channel protein MscL [Actinomadura parmotrematis]MBW8481714.1 large conductance mechanosensitive channel protein MscL [Actinomadura parmotrematis]
MGGFKKFLFRGNLVDLAVAVVVGAAFGSLVKDFTTSFIAPLISLFGGKPDYTKLSIKISDTTFPYGVFLTSAISFFITAVIVYFIVVLPTAKLIERLDGHKEATERECPQCLSEIPVKARRCRFCTVEVLPTNEAPA